MLLWSGCSRDRVLTVIYAPVLNLSGETRLWEAGQTDSLLPQETQSQSLNRRTIKMSRYSTTLEMLMLIC